MEASELKSMAQRLLAGEIDLDRFVDALAQPISAHLGEVTLDLDRARRCGFPEVVFGESKSVETLAKIFERLLAAGHEVLATRVSAEKANELLAAFPSARYNEIARIMRVPLPDTGPQPAPSCGHVAVVTAGTSDLPVAEEARETLAWMGIEAVLVHDVGVAGPHRLPEQLHHLRGAAAVVVVAGMEGALPSVVGGHVDCPVVAVPTSVGYGASLGGMAALLGMLNSCAANVTVVNIDAGFKGGYVAGMIARQSVKQDSPSN